jgi:uroporphyrinogen decarboxylase
VATDLEVFRDMAAHRRPERLFYGAGFTPDLKRRVIEHIGTEEINKHYGFWRERGVDLKRLAGRPAPDYSRYWHGQELPPGTFINDWGVAEVPSGFYHFTGYLSPLRNATSLKELEEFAIEDQGDWDTSHMAGQVRQAHAEGKVTTAWIGHMYEIAWQIRGYEEFLLDTMDQPAWAECLLERLFQRNMNRAKAFAGAGVDFIRCGDDVANQNSLMFAPEVWRRLIHSRWAKVWATVKRIHPAAVIHYHTDGNVMAIVPELVEAGLDFLNPVQPECLDGDEVHRRWGGRLGFDGCIGTQSTMPWGTTDDVRKRVKEVVDKYGQTGGLIISPTHVLEPEVPLANIDAFAEACRQYGAR